MPINLNSINIFLSERLKKGCSIKRLERITCYFERLLGSKSLFISEFYENNFLLFILKL